MKRAFANLMLSFNPWGRFWLMCAISALVVDAGISYQYGVTETKWHGYGFALAAIFFMFFPDAAYEEFQAGRKGPGLTLAAASVLLGLVSFQAHIGYRSGVRSGDMQETEMQATKVSNINNLVKENTANLKARRDRHAQLSKERADLREAYPWAATITVDGLKGELKTTQDKLAREVASGRDGRPKGCGKECERLKDLSDGITKRIGSVEKFNELGNQLADLDRQISMAENSMGQNVTTAAGTNLRQSSVVNQNANLGTLWLTLTGADAEKAIAPDKVTTNFVSLIVSGFGSLAFLIMAPLAWYLARRNRVVGPMMHAAAAHVTTAMQAVTATAGPNGPVARPRLVNTSFSDSFEQMYPASKVA